MAKTKTELPDLTARQLKFLNMYRGLEREMGRAPSLQEVFVAADGWYASHAGVQKMVDVLAELGVIEKPRWTEGGTTKTGRHVLVRARRRGLI